MHHMKSFKIRELTTVEDGDLAHQDLPVLAHTHKSQLTKFVNLYASPSCASDSDDTHSSRSISHSYQSSRVDKPTNHWKMQPRIPYRQFLMDHLLGSEQAKTLWSIW